ncbi:hypothetical protein DV737_g1668, partial [Chaetothyriales sp. CBS 132003]
MPPSAPKVCVFGTGAVGATYAYILWRAGIPAQSITCICRSNYSAAAASGFTIDSELWGANLRFHPNVVRSISVAASHGPFDYNGIAIEPPYARAHPANPLLSTVVHLSVSSVAPALISHYARLEHLHIGTYPADAPAPHNAAAVQLAELLRRGGASATVHDDVQGARWAKVVVNGAWNSLCALTRSRSGDLLASSPRAADHVRSVMREIAAVARASGYSHVDEQFVESQMERAKAMGLPGAQPSMLEDALAGRAMEVDAIVGHVLEIAREKAVATPQLEAVYVLLRALDQSFKADRARQSDSRANGQTEKGDKERQRGEEIDIDK